MWAQWHRVAWGGSGKRDCRIFLRLKMVYGFVLKNVIEPIRATIVKYLFLALLLCIGVLLPFVYHFLRYSHAILLQVY